MKCASDLSISDKCHECSLQAKGFFCQLSPESLLMFESIKVTKVYPKGALLFVEGQPSTGVFMLCQGKAKLSTCSENGKIIILDVAQPGDILGLSAAVNGEDHETTAEVLELCQANYVDTAHFIRYLKANPEACLNAARQLSRNYQTAYRQVCSLGLSDSVAGKLAKLFLSWTGTTIDGRVTLRNSYTHEEMAEMIGTSRETVTRAIKYFRESGLITVKGPRLVIQDQKRLRAIIGSRNSSHSKV